MSPTVLVLASVLALSTVVLVWSTKSDVCLAGNESSRLATVQALVEDGTFTIEGSRFRSPDIVRIGGRFYSDKPPLLSCWLASVYAPLYHVFGISFRDPATYHDAVRWVTALGIVPFSIALVALFFRKLGQTKLPPAPRALLAASVVFGTWIGSFGTTVNNHTPAAAALFAAWVLLDGRPDRLGRGRMLAAGLATGLLINLDVPTGAIFAAGGTLALRGGTLPFALGLVPGVAALAGLNFLQHGHVLPAYLMPGAYAYEGCLHPETLAGQRTPTDVAGYLFTITVGARGVFSHMPVLLFALLAPAPSSPAGSRPGRSPILLAAAASVALFYGTRTGDYGGWAYGFRYLVPLLPVLFWFSVEGFLRIRNRRYVRSVIGPVYGAALAFGIGTSVVGSWNPWPVCDEGAATAYRVGMGSLSARIDARVRSPFAANLLCASFEWQGTGGLTPVLARWALGTHAYDEELTLRYLDRAFKNLRREDRMQRFLTRGRASP